MTKLIIPIIILVLVLGAWFFKYADAVVSTLPPGMSCMQVVVERRHPIFGYQETFPTPCYGHRFMTWFK